MSLLGTLSISASALTAQQLRMDILSQNMANVDTTRTAEGGPYRRRNVQFQEYKITEPFGSALSKAGARRAVSKLHPEPEFDSGNKGVRVKAIVPDLSDGPMVYDPTHPDADEQGYVAKPNVNVVTEMVDLISASRSYEANVTAINVTKAMINKTFEIGKA